MEIRCISHKSKDTSMLKKYFLKDSMSRMDYSQIEAYITSYNILCELQSGFRWAHSTESCIMFLTEHIRRREDTGKFCGIVLLDLQKFRAVAFSEAAIEWVQSYLQILKGQCKWDYFWFWVNNVWGPPGECPWAIIFLIVQYINDLKSACSCDLYLFASDASVITSHKDKASVENKLCCECTDLGWRRSLSGSLITNFLFT